MKKLADKMSIKQSIIFSLTLLLFISTGQELLAADDSRNKKGAPWVGLSLSGKPCDGKRQGFGPFDYQLRTKYRKQLKLVAGAHFTNNVRYLIKGKRGYLVDDIDYTLRAWPNHHQALQSISQYQILHSTSIEEKYSRKTISPVECYFQRAINFSPRDAITHMLYAIYLQKINYEKKASEHYEAAIAISPDNMSIRYNYGLLLFSVKQYQKSLENAHKAYAAGYPLLGLKNKLIKSGHWNEPKIIDNNLPSN